VKAGDSYNVNFPIIQRASTNFYHAHPDMHTGKQVYMGLAGMFIIEDDEEKSSWPSFRGVRYTLDDNRQAGLMRTSN